MFWLRTVAVLWLLGIVGGAVILVRHQSTPGTAGPCPAQWPKEAQVARNPWQPTLLMFAHPQCPCTRASIGELNRLLARCGNPPAAHVFFLEPAGADESWIETDSYRSASSMPEVRVHIDRGGEQARLFGAGTSGHVVLYDLGGRLVFTGGITAGRGHAGDNAGAESIVGFINNSSVRIASTPVYGCGLFNSCKQEVLCAK